MRKYLAALFVLLPLLAFANAEQGDKLYQSAQYSRALEQYSAALKQNTGNAYLYYNIGNCYFKTGSLGEAVAYYYKAFAINPRSPQIRQNLDFALNKSGQNLVPPGMPPALHKAFYFFSGAELKGLCVVAGWLFCFALMAFVLKRRFGKTAVFFALMIAVFGVWYYALSGAQAKVDGVIVTPNAQLRSGPGDNFDVAATLPAGYLVTVEDASGQWFLVTALKENLKGWTLKENFIDPKEI